MNSIDTKKDKMITAARALFIEHGFKATSLDMIIKKTGGSRRNIYTYFDGRDGLIKAVLERIAEDVLTSFETLPSYDVPVKNWLITLGERYLTTMTERDVVGMLRQLISLSDEDHEIGKFAFSNGPELLAKRVEDYLRYQVEIKHLKIDDVSTTAHIFIEMIKGKYILKALMAHSDAPNQEEISRHVGIVVKIFLKGVELPLEKNQ